MGTGYLRQSSQTQVISMQGGRVDLCLRRFVAPKVTLGARMRGPEAVARVRASDISNELLSV